MIAPFRVLIPERIFKEANTEKEIIELVLQYMQRYPHYDFKYLENNFAICERVERGDTNG
jgi:hypothetical protein